MTAFSTFKTSGNIVTYGHTGFAVLNAWQCCNASSRQGSDSGLSKSYTVTESSLGVARRTVEHGASVLRCLGSSLQRREVSQH